MNNLDLDHLNLKDLKSVAKYYKIDHKPRIKRVELEALIYMAEHVQALEMHQIYHTVKVGEEYGIDVFDVQAVPHSVLGGVQAVPHSVLGGVQAVPHSVLGGVLPFEHKS